MKAMLFAAGLGTRLKPFTDNKPKALAEVNNTTLLEHNIRYLQRFGNITISDERDEVLETGGGLKKAMPFFEGENAFVVMNVDVLTNLDLNKLISRHASAGSLATLAVMKRDSSRHQLFDDNMALCGWKNNKTNEERISRQVPSPSPYAFSGIQVVSPGILQNTPFSGKFSLIDLYLHVAKEHTIKGFDHTGDVFIDVGKPESIAQAEQLFMK